MGEFDSSTTTSTVFAFDNSSGGGDYDNCTYYSGSDNNNNSNCTSDVAAARCKPQEYYSFNYALVGTLFQSIIFVVGVLGNLLVCAVVRRTRSMHSTTNCYLVSLALADTITLVASVPQEILSYHILGDQWVWGQVGCTLMIYLQVLSSLFLLLHTCLVPCIAHHIRIDWVSFLRFLFDLAAVAARLLL